LQPDTQDIHPPLYFFLLRLWASVVGWNAAQLRAFSILMSLVGLALLFAVVRELSGNFSGLWAAMIMAVAQPQVDLARDARPYTMLVALALATAWALVRIEKYGLNRRRLAALAIGCLALPMTHYFGIFVDVTLVVYAMMRLRGKDRRAALGASVGPVVLFLVAWGPVLYLQAHGVSGGGTVIFHDTEPHHFHQTFARLALMPVRYLYEPLPDSLYLSMGLAVLYLVPFILPRRRPDLLLWGLWVPINILPSLLVDLTHHTFSLEIDRYTFLASVGVYALLPALCRGLSPWLRHALPAAAVAGCLIHLPQAYSTFGRTRQDWRKLAGQYRELAEPGCLTVFLSSPNDYTYFLCLGKYVSPLPGPALMLTNQPSADMLRKIRAFDRVVVVGALPFAGQFFPNTTFTDIRLTQSVGAVWVLPPVPGPTTRQTFADPPHLPPSTR
jgi:4-amino-4-deoxy-L-arabinose transferase-like glycosyltransferase